MKAEKQLKARIQKLREQLQDIQGARAKKNAIKLVGKCFKYRNNCSCPQKESDYWWMYLAITNMNNDGELVGFEFQKDSRGVFTVRVRVVADTCIDGKLMSGWQPIRANELVGVWQSLHYAYALEFSEVLRQLA